MDQQGGVLMSVGIRADSILLNRARIPLYTAVGVVTVLIAAGLGWLLAGPAIRPLRRLTEQTMRLGKGTDQMAPVHGAREAEELSDAMAGMLSRLAAAQQATTNSLQAAQDFAANAAHELRTPLTAMRADLDTLRIHDLPAEERDEVVGDLARAQRRVEAIITALGQLASGQLAQAEDRELIDVTDMLDRVARENMRRRRHGRDRGGGRRRPRHHLGLARRPAAGGGQPGAQRDHARRRPPASCWPRTADGPRDGRSSSTTTAAGCPPRSTTTVLGRFARGSTAAPGGSGLGLALVAQQAALHGGRIELSDGPLGGLRATLTVSTSPEPHRIQISSRLVSAEPGPLRGAPAE